MACGIEAMAHESLSRAPAHTAIRPQFPPTQHSYQDLTGVVRFVFWHRLCEDGRGSCFKTRPWVGFRIFALVSHPSLIVALVSRGLVLVSQNSHVMVVPPLCA